ncbi:MAG: hypothetical protein C4346_11650 [Chloroflexota bacterium]
MAIEHHYLAHPEHLPQNTVVVLPKPLPANRSALWTLFWALGLLMGIVLRSLLDGPAGIASPEPSARQAYAAAPDQPPPTMEVHVHAVLALPTATPTATLRPQPSATPDLASQTSFCGTAEPGKLCRIPYPPPPTPTPFPPCTEMTRLQPGDWCVWPTEAPEYLASRE